MADRCRRVEAERGGAAPTLSRPWRARGQRFARDALQPVGPHEPQPVPSSPLLRCSRNGEYESEAVALSRPATDSPRWSSVRAERLDGCPDRHEVGTRCDPAQWADRVRNARSAVSGSSPARTGGSTAACATCRSGAGECIGVVAGDAGSGRSGASGCACLRRVRLAGPRVIGFDLDVLVALLVGPNRGERTPPGEVLVTLAEVEVGATWCFRSNADRLYDGRWRRWRR